MGPPGVNGTVTAGCHRTVTRLAAITMMIMFTQAATEHGYESLRLPGNLAAAAAAAGPSCRGGGRQPG